MVNMTKKLLFITLLVLTCGFLFAVGSSNELLIDKSNFLSESLFAEIKNELEEFAAKGKTELSILLIPDTGEKTAEAFADDFFDYNGYGIGADKEGALLLIVTGEKRGAYISTHGNETIGTITDERIEKLLDALIDGGLAEGDYESGLKKFTAKFKKYFFNEISFIDAIASAGVAFFTFITGFFTTKNKYKLKEARPQYNQAKNSFANLNSFEDVLLSSNTVSRIITRDTGGGGSGGGSSTHTSSSGETHGGGGRSF